MLNIKALGHVCLLGVFVIPFLKNWNEALLSKSKSDIFYFRHTSFSGFAYIISGFFFLNFRSFTEHYLHVGWSKTVFSETLVILSISFQIFILKIFSSYNFWCSSPHFGFHLRDFCCQHLGSSSINYIFITSKTFTFSNFFNVKFSYFISSFSCVITYLFSLVIFSSFFPQKNFSYLSSSCV